mgnify:CR=1 FL=1
MIATVVVLVFQLSGVAAAETKASEADAPKLVCTMEPVTGTRARKQRVCKPSGGFDPRSERAQDILRGIQGGGAESGFSQADVAYWAYTGTGTFEGKPKVTDLRLIANLYPESFHLVVRKAANIKSVADLKGKRVSLDEPGSGTLVNARAILAAYGVTEKDIKPEFLKPNAAGEKLKDNSLDAFFFVGGYPAGAIAELAATGGIDVLSISGPEADKLVKQFGFYAVDNIPADTYKGVGAVKTLAVGAQWVTSAKQDATLVYNITKALWSDNARKALDAGHAKGKAIVRANAVAGAGIPLHPGAEKFYKEVGLVK